MTREEMVKTWAALKKYYPNSSRSDEKNMRAYLSALEPYPAAAVNDACKAYVQSGGRYWPDVSDIIERLPKADSGHRVSEMEILSNVRVFARRLGFTMPSGMTPSEAWDWLREKRSVARP